VRVVADLRLADLLAVRGDFHQRVGLLGRDQERAAGRRERDVARAAGQPHLLADLARAGVDEDQPRRVEHGHGRHAAVGIDRDALRAPADAHDRALGRPGRRRAGTGLGGLGRIELRRGCGGARRGRLPLLAAGGEDERRGDGGEQGGGSAEHEQTVPRTVREFVDGNVRSPSYAGDGL
jgi:hypothetical protein